MAEKSQRLMIMMVLFGLVSGLGVALYSRSRTSGSAELERKAPSFSLADRAGKMVQLEDLAGKVIYLHFWAAWCAPCADELPAVLKFAEEMKDESRFRLVLISLDPGWEQAESILPPAGKLPPNVVSLIDPSMKISQEYGSYQFPETYLLDPELQIVTKWVGAQEWSSDSFKKIVQKMNQ